MVNTRFVKHAVRWWNYKEPWDRQRRVINVSYRLRTTVPLFGVAVANGSAPGVYTLTFQTAQVPVDLLRLDDIFLFFFVTNLTQSPIPNWKKNQPPEKTMQVGMQLLGIFVDGVEVCFIPNKKSNRAYSVCWLRRNFNLKLCFSVLCDEVFGILPLYQSIQTQCYCRVLWENML